MKKDYTEVFITVSAWAVYLYLVITKIANVEGFVALTVYIIKKALDSRETNQTNKESENEPTKTNTNNNNGSNGTVTSDDIKS